MKFNEFHYQVRGRGHQTQGTRGQDRTTYLSRGGVQALCLADGAGSASHSEFGAQAVADAGCAMLVEHFADFADGQDAEESRRAVLRYLHGRLADVAVRLGCSLDDLAATFLAVGTGIGRFVVIHIGDGVIGFLKNGELRVVSAPDNSEFANQTTFVTSSAAATSMRLFRGSVDGVAGFVLMSDGTSASLYNYRTKQLAPASAKLIELVGAAPTRRTRNPEYRKQLRQLMDTHVRTATKDDCSIAILALRSANRRQAQHRLNRG